MRLKKIPFPLILILSFWFFVCHATTILRLSLEEMCQKADGIFLGRCISKESKWNEERTKIYTYVTIQLDKILKCQDPGLKIGSKIVIKQLGGTVDNIGMKVSGISHFQPKEEVLVFLKRTTPGNYRVLGMAQGKYSIEQDPRTKKKFIHRDLSNINLIDERSLFRGSMKKELRSSQQQIIYLDDFITHLEKILKTQEKSHQLHSE